MECGGRSGYENATLAPVYLHTVANAVVLNGFNHLFAFRQEVAGNRDVTGKGKRSASGCLGEFDEEIIDV